MMPTMMFSSQPCSRLVPAIMLATQPANAPKMIQEMMPRTLSIEVLQVCVDATRRRLQPSGCDGGVKPSGWAACRRVADQWSPGGGGPCQRAAKRRQLSLTVMGWGVGGWSAFFVI